MLRNTPREREHCYREALVLASKHGMKAIADRLGITPPYNPRLWRVIGIYWVNTKDSLDAPGSMRYWLNMILEHFGRRNMLDTRAGRVGRT